MGLSRAAGGPVRLEHYGHVKRNGNWLGEPGSSLAKFGGGHSGADFFRGALATLRATYIGYHGDARDWYTENPELTVELLNRCGYWYFLHRVEVPEKLAPGSRHPLRLAWENVPLQGRRPAELGHRVSHNSLGKSTFQIPR